MRSGQQIRAIFRLFALFSVLVAVALISAVTTIRLTIHSGEEKMPSFVGKSLNQTKRTASLLGLGVKVEDRLFSAKYPADSIVSQIPAAGTEVKPGQDVHVLVSLGAPKVTVPNLIGASVRVAQILAGEHGLAMGGITAVHGDEAPAGQIVSQDPPATTTEVRSPTVNLLVSLGPPPAAFVCPFFVGLPLERARAQIVAAGFKLGRVTAIPSSPAAGSVQNAPPASASLSLAASATTRRGFVLTQSPSPGSKIEPGATFDFQVSE